MLSYSSFIAWCKAVMNASSTEERLADIEVRLNNCLQQLEGYRQLLETRSKEYEQWPTIDFVDLGSLKAFMYTGDMVYELWVPQESKAASPLEHLEQVKASGFKYSDVPTERPCKDNALYCIIDHYWALNKEFVCMDIGAQYGTSRFLSKYGQSALDLATFVKSRGRRNRVIAFEPGEAGNLTSYNIEVNGLADIVTLERIAVASHSLPLILSQVSGHTENNTIINTRLRNGNRCVVTSCTSVDDYLERNGVSGDLIVKIDAEGAEPYILSGMTDALRSRDVSILLEFAPTALPPEIEPASFLTSLGQDAYVFDLPFEEDLPMRAVTASDYDELTIDTVRRTYSWTDLLVIPKKLPGSARLVDSFCNGQ